LVSITKKNLATVCLKAECITITQIKRTPFWVNGVSGAGADVIILKLFLPKYLAKKLAFFIQTTSSFLQKFDQSIDV
jgi:hypothetical protein